VDRAQEDMAMGKALEMQKHRKFDSVVDLVLVVGSKMPAEMQVWDRTLDK